MENVLLLLLLLLELLPHSEVAPPAEFPPPILFLTCKLVSEFLWIRNTYIYSAFENILKGKFKNRAYIFSLLFIIINLSYGYNGSYFFSNIIVKLKILIIKLL